MSEPTAVPINAKFGDDFVTILVVVTSADTMDQVAEKVAHHVVGRRLPKRDAPMAVYHRGRAVERGLTVAEAGITPMQYVFVDYV